MYSPKIREELIPRLWRLARARKVPMTKLVNQILREALDEWQGEKEVSHAGKISAWANNGYQWGA